jgi:DNA-binding beta-propeller fold protein YncE
MSTPNDCKRRMKAGLVVAAALWVTALVSPGNAQRGPMLAVADQSQDAVNLYDVNGPALKLKKSVPAGKSPGRMCLDSAGTTLFVANATGAQAIDLASQTPAEGFADSGIKRTFGCIVSLDGQKLYLADRDANLIFVFSVSSHQLIKKIPGCEDARYGIYTPDRKSLVFSCGAGSLAVIDPATDTVKRTIKTVGMDPRSMVLTRDGKYLGVAMVSSDMVNWYRADTLDLVSLFGVTRSPQGFVIAADGERAYVSGVYEGVIGVIDLREKNHEGEGEWRQASVIPTGPAFSIDISPDGNYLYATPSDGAIAVVDLRSWKILKVPLKGAGNLLFVK